MDEKFYIIRSLWSLYRISSSFEEIKSHIFEYADDWTPKGTCCIEKVNSKCECLEKWYFFGGELEEHSKLVNHEWITENFDVDRAALTYKRK
jgi:hypothetical protein